MNRIVFPRQRREKMLFSSQINDTIYPFLLKLAQKSCCKYRRACNFFEILRSMLISFLNDINIQLILRIKKQFWKISSGLS